MKKTLLLLLFSAQYLLSVYSADLAQIMVAEGSAFTLIREGASYAFDLGIDDVKGMTLYRGDTIMTEADTFLEIHLFKGSTMIKLAGNTTITIEQLDREGGGVFRIGYGRVRARVNGLSPRGEFYLLTNEAAAGVKGVAADFGFDLLYVMIPDEQGKEVKGVLTHIYSFEGDVSAAIFPQGIETKGKKMNKPETIIPLTGNEMITIIQNPGSTVPETTAVEKEIITFWKGYPFGKVSELVQGDGTSGDDLVLQGLEWEIPQGESMRSRMKRAGALTFGLGAGIISLGLLTSLFVPPESRNTSYIFAGFGGGISLLGTGYIFGSYLYPDEEPPLLDQ